MARRFYYTEPGRRIEDVSMERGFGFDMTGCVVPEYFQLVGEEELCQRVICAQDVRSATRHGLRLTRSGVLARGADRCDFRCQMSTVEGEKDGAENAD